jgi:hypothetical protein
MPPSGHGSTNRKGPDFRRARFDQHLRARIQRRARRHHVVDERQSRAREHPAAPRCQPDPQTQTELPAKIPAA